MVFRLKYFICLFLLAVVTDTNAQFAMQPFAKAYGINGYYFGKAVDKTFDKGYILAGATSAVGAGSSDILLIKVDSTANVIQWQRTYGGINNEWAYAVKQTPDNGFMVAGYTNSIGAGGYDAYLLKVDSLGEKLWEKTYGGSDWDFIYSMTATYNGNYILVGETFNNSNGLNDAYLVKVDSDGNLIWEKNYGGAKEEALRSVTEDLSHNLIASGFTQSFGNNRKDAYLLKLNENGDTLWTKIYGDTLNDELNCVTTSKINGGYWAVGYTEGNLGIYEKNKLVLKIDVNGNQIMIDSSNVNGNQELFSIIENQDTNIYTMGNAETAGFGNDVEFFLFDRYINYMYSGNSFGYNAIEQCYFMLQDNDSCFVSIGNTNGFGNAMSSVYFIKSNLKRSGLSTTDNINGIEYRKVDNDIIKVYPNPSSDYFIIEGVLDLKKIKIINLAGNDCTNKFIFTFKSRNQIMIENIGMEPGIYILNAGNGNFYKFVLQKLL